MTLKAMAKHIEYWTLDRLTPYERNPRTHSDSQVTQIGASMTTFGFNSPILVDSQGGIIAGHGRLLAARELQLDEVPVIVLDHLTEDEKAAYIIADNKLAENAGWDEELLRSQLAALEEEGVDLKLLGFEDEELALLLADQDLAEGITDEDAVPPLAATPVTVRGDLWLLGSNHRVLCGDATTRADVDRLMGGEKADMVFTDPPYNVAVEGYTKEKLTIQNDNMDPAEFGQFLRDSFVNYLAFIKPTASLYVCHASSVQRQFENQLDAAGFAVRCQIIWAKNTFAWGFGRYKFQHEPIFYCHVAGQSDAWYGDKTQSTLWQEKKPAANRLHPTMKPVELMERALLNSSKSGDVVVDLFGGSGSTMIACERRGRKARLMEIDPKYADCIVRRWQEYTGKQAVLDGDGRTFADVARERLRAAA